MPQLRKITTKEGLCYMLQPWNAGALRIPKHVLKTRIVKHVVKHGFAKYFRCLFTVFALASHELIGA
jgi:hypothetical protein